MRIKKIIFVGLVSLLASVNLFSVTYNFEKNAKNELETIEKEYLQSDNDDKKKKFLIVDRRYVFREHFIKFRSNEAFEYYKKSTKKMNLPFLEKKITTGLSNCQSCLITYIIKIL